MNSYDSYIGITDNGVFSSGTRMKKMQKFNQVSSKTEHNFARSTSMIPTPVLPRQEDQTRTINNFTDKNSSRIRKPKVVFTPH